MTPETEIERLRRIFAKSMLRYFKSGRKVDIYPRTHKYLVKRINYYRLRDL